MIAMPLVAEILSWLIPIVILVLYLVNHLLSSSKPAEKQPRNQPPRRRGPEERPFGAAGQQQKPPQRGETPSQLNNEIEQFLKRANERRMEKARREPPASAAKQPPPDETPVDVVPLDRRDFDSVVESVRKHFADRGFDERARHMIDDISESEAEMDAHRRQVFDHRLGTLETSASEMDAPSADDPLASADRQANAKAMAGLLTNSRSLRQAILLKEILERPVDRW